MPTPDATASPTVVLLIGSVRPSSNTAKAAATFAATLVKGGATVDVIDPRSLAVTVAGAETHIAIEKALADTLRARVAAADGVAFVTPEYDGSFSAVCKVLIEALGYPSSAAGKPATVIGVASGRTGAARAVDQLRGVLYSIGALVLPRSPSVAAVHKAFDPAGACLRPEVAAALATAARELLAFATRARA